MSSLKKGELFKGKILYDFLERQINGEDGNPIAPFIELVMFYDKDELNTMQSKPIPVFAAQMNDDEWLHWKAMAFKKQCEELCESLST